MLSSTFLLPPDAGSNREPPLQGWEWCHGPRTGPVGSPCWQRSMDVIDILENIRPFSQKSGDRFCRPHTARGLTNKFRLLLYSRTCVIASQLQTYHMRDDTRVDRHIWVESKAHLDMSYYQSERCHWLVDTGHLSCWRQGFLTWAPIVVWTMTAMTTMMSTMTTMMSAMSTMTTMARLRYSMLGMLDLYVGGIKSYFG